ncbi:dehydrogenase/reductase oxidoreductase protein [Trichosporon asahii var. asahii CBS 2479]|uniref:Dehydrogenase/reductase oxidoreductase protein n=1 Tax=Trichosporon asahii var. asahii (strain ATCC 90039 / CBS 2479 / JCM 2466 / KCTC 7840 / NBRC 103889/ NCYC 2677 / UAMH 7654) TaxID=1186058 RepID=J6F5X8_TRIAS|nr:dehydrogenase/reductase oxidoreductase protein [Trichosporon asahii var. asahii CBS 2479]EJT50707.1 dehydrogenase/reductase oxidoreductase protein [Trichosporon asahii var. asahii CBS 2479]
MLAVDALANPLDLTGRVALVTGGSGGIGRAIVSLFLQRGAKVATTFVPGVEDAQKLHETFGSPASLTFHPLDLRSADSIQACLDSALEEDGRLDILVNNAAVGSATVAAWTDSVAAQDAAMLAINADGTLKACQHFLTLPHSGDFPRKLINISSVGGGIAIFPGFRLSDGMSKAAVAFLTRQLGAECCHKAVDVFAVCPGATNTEMFRQSTLNPMSEQQRTDFLKALPKGRLIEPGEIAAIVNFLAGSASTVMNGAVIDASMGLGVRPGIMTEMEH